LWVRGASIWEKFDVGSGISDDADAIVNTLNQVSFKEQWYDSLTKIRQLVGAYEYEAAMGAIQAHLNSWRFL
jgi:hypothetical protein